MQVEQACDIGDIGIVPDEDGERRVVGFWQRGRSGKDARHHGQKGQAGGKGLRPGALKDVLYRGVDGQKLQRRSRGYHDRPVQRRVRAWFLLRLRRKGRVRGGGAQYLERLFFNGGRVCPAAVRVSPKALGADRPFKALQKKHFCG